MKTFTVGLALLVTIGLCIAIDVVELKGEFVELKDDVVEYEEIEDVAVYEDEPVEVITDETELVLDFLSIPIIPERYKSEEFKQTWGITNPLRAFHWKDCGGYGGHVVFMSVSPDPIKLPGPITFSIHTVANITLASPLKTKLTIEKKVFDKYITIPCIDNLGSCTYDDLCAMLPSGPCPGVFSKYGIPCHCPIAPGAYSLPPTNQDVPRVPLLPGGDYRITVQLFDTSAKSLACLQLELSIKS